RVIRIFNGQIYTSSASGMFQGISTIGTGLPTSGVQSATILPGFPTVAGPSNYDFFFADPNTLYVCDDRPSAAGGIEKWVFSGGNWNLVYTLNPSLNIGCRGITGIVTAGQTVLYATTAETAFNHIVMVTDTGPSSAFAVLATAPLNEVFRDLR